MGEVVLVAEKREPQRPKAALTLNSCGTAEVVPFPHIITLPYVIAVPVHHRPS